MFLPLTQRAKKPKQEIGLEPNGHIAASVCFCSRKILRILFILSKQSDRLWMLTNHFIIVGSGCSKARILFSAGLDTGYWMSVLFVITPKPVRNEQEIEF
jgi:hypothetical protein